MMLSPFNHKLLLYTIVAAAIVAALSMWKIVRPATSKTVPNVRFLVPHSKSYPGILLGLARNDKTLDLVMNQPDSHISMRINLATMQYEASWCTSCDDRVIVRDSAEPAMLTDAVLLDWMQKGHIDTNNPVRKSEAAELLSSIRSLAQSKEATLLDKGLQYFDTEKIEESPTLPRWALCVFVLCTGYVIWGLRGMKRMQRE
jgi:hypothetical protein